MADPFRLLPPETARQGVERLADRTSGHRALWVFYFGGSHEINEPLRARLREVAFPAGHQWFSFILAAAYSLPREPTAPGAGGVAFQKAINLQSSALTLRAKPGGSVNLALTWQATELLDQDYKVFVHLVDGAGQRWAQHDGEPDGGERPTSGWMPGELVRDHHGLLLPAGAPAGAYGLIIGLYVPGQGRLSLIDGGDALKVGPVQVLAD